MPDSKLSQRASSRLSPRADQIMKELVVRRGLSYDHAIREAEAMAASAASPYQEVAAELRRWLEEHGR